MTIRKTQVEDMPFITEKIKDFHLDGEDLAMMISYKKLLDNCIAFRYYAL